MSLIKRRRKATGETPEQTLSRLQSANPVVVSPVVVEPPAVESAAAVPLETAPSQQPRFTLGRRGSGYAVEQVDAFMDTIDQRTVDEVHKVVFRPPGPFTCGYDVDEVDVFLDGEIARKEGATNGSPGAP